MTLREKLFTWIGTVADIFVDSVVHHHFYDDVDGFDQAAMVRCVRAMRSAQRWAAIVVRRERAARERQRRETLS
ncbi:MAG: hypothetical protein ACRDNM_00055 [Gaiellaceae bacterium]